MVNRAKQNEIMKAIILDDEKHCVQTLETLLKKHTSIEVVATYLDPLKAIKSIHATSFDILFLDIEMPHLNGFEFLSLFPDNSWHVVFTTAYDEYAVKAFKINAVEYLMKPIASSDLKSAISKIESGNITADSQASKFPWGMMKSLQARMQKFAIPTLAGLEMLQVMDVEYLESDSNYTHIVLNGEEKHTASKTLRYFEQLLEPYGFLRIHNSYLVNPNRIKRYVKGDGGYVIMESGKDLPVSRARKEGLLNSLNRL